MSEAPAIMDPRDEEVDPELLELPDPPKRDRTITVALLLVTAVAAVLAAIALRRDAAYAFVAPEAQDIGDIAAASPATFAPNRFVRGTAMLGAAHAIRYERPFVSDSFRLMPVVKPNDGAPNVWVEVRVPSGAENIRWVPPAQVTGRLVRFDGSGPKHRGLVDAVHDATGREVPKDSWLLVEGDAPSGARLAVVLVLLFFGFAVWNVIVTARLLRKVA
jgi:hypothetical protein